MLTDHDDFGSSSPRSPWNKGRLVGQKRPLKPKDVWSIRVRLEIAGSLRDLALFNLAIDSKLRACDLVSLRVDDILSDGRIRERTTVVQQKTARPVQFEMTAATRNALAAWIDQAGRRPGDYLFVSVSIESMKNTNSSLDQDSGRTADPLFLPETAGNRIGQRPQQILQEGPLGSFD
ncbi:tyrosine-type recombinase/integrase [Nisaea sp.]|uniref:tyrosine-type recombinase/integrase n=1 Tax=Nisaea sp. TaxID=2024842 RepID=UPI0032ED14DC